MRTVEPVAVPNRRVVYSQLSYILLGYALSNYMGGGKNFTQIFDELIVKPLNLTNTGTPDNQVTSRAVIPSVNNWWNSDFGETVPYVIEAFVVYSSNKNSGGGIHSSTNDFSVILNSLLNHKMLSDIDFYGWLKPSALTSSPWTMVGAPWEMARYDNMTPTYPQIIDVYGKGGSAYGYNCKLAVIEQYGLGAIWLTAGEPWPVLLIPDMLFGQLIPAIEEETRQQAKDNYAFMFYNFKRNATVTDSQRYAPGNVEFGVTVDTGPGLVITNLMRNGVNILSHMGDIYRETFGKLGDIPTTVFPLVRMYPMDVYSYEIGTSGVELVREDWRIKWDPSFDFSKSNWTGTDLTSFQSSGDACGSWVITDWIHYAGISIEKITFIKEVKSNRVIGVELPWLRANLTVDRSRPIVPSWSNIVNSTKSAVVERRWEKEQKSKKQSRWTHPSLKKTDLRPTWEEK